MPRIIITLWATILLILAAGAYHASTIDAHGAAKGLTFVLIILLLPIPLINRNRILATVQFLIDKRKEANQRRIALQEERMLRERERRQRILQDAHNQEVLFLKRYAAPNLMLGLYPDQFEQFVLRYFRVLGFEAQETRSTGDGGIDGFLKRGGKLFVLQCKRWAGRSVGEPELRDLLGVITKHNAAGGIFVTTSTFAASAEKWVQGTTIEILDGETFAARIKSLAFIDPALR